jgi:hypothetical protein
MMKRDNREEPEALRPEIGRLGNQLIPKSVAADEIGCLGDQLIPKAVTPEPRLG